MEVPYIKLAEAVTGMINDAILNSGRYEGHWSSPYAFRARISDLLGMGEELGMITLFNGHYVRSAVSPNRNIGIEVTAPFASLDGDRLVRMAIESTLCDKLVAAYKSR